MDIQAQRYEIKRTKEHLAALKQNIQDWETKLADDEKLLAEMEARESKGSNMGFVFHISIYPL